MTIDPPPEPEGGQDDEKPDRLLAVIVAIRLFNDLEDRLDGPQDHDLRLRLIAVRSVLRRLKERWEAAQDDG